MLAVHSFESFGTFDGPGIRLVIFLQGCNFKCLYCANPDTITLKGGTQTPIEEIVKMAKNQRPFFGDSGGVTISGGEPLLQAEELQKLFRALKEENFHCCIDTNGSILNDSTKELLKLTDIVLLDIKHVINDEHKKITARNNDRTLEFAKYLKNNNITTWIRYVLVPGYTDSEDALTSLGETFKEYNNIEKLEIQPYHSLGVHKYKHLDMPYQLTDVEHNTPEQLQRAKDMLTPYFKEIIIN